MTVKLKFLGAAKSVTGSKFLVQTDKSKIIVDVGIFQGRRELRERNWRTPEVDLSELDAALLTHAHIDHTGLLPRYYKLGLNCPVYATRATTSLCKLLLPDSGHIQEEDAKYKAKKKKSRHNPPKPLYTSKDALEVLKNFKSIDFNKEVKITEDISATWERAGHIIGAAHLTIKAEGKVINFSGDIGRYGIPILVDPSPQKLGDLLLIESTYGARNHSPSPVKEVLADVINRTYQRGGTVVIPSFAVGRAQLLLYFIRELKEKKLIPDLPVVIDSPMATDATEIYRDFPTEYDDHALGIIERGNRPFNFNKLALITDRKASIQLNSIDTPMVIISASGMMTGGRILHHVKNRVEDKKNTVLFVGYQPPGGKGQQLQSGVDKISIFNQLYNVRAEIETISGMSAHADQSELLRWCKSCTGTPGCVGIIHGEPDQAEVFKEKLKTEMNWPDVFVADYLSEIEV